MRIRLAVALAIVVGTAADARSETAAREPLHRLDGSRMPDWCARLQEHHRLAGPAIQALGGGRFLLRAAGIDDTPDRLPCRIVPDFRHGEMIGLRLFSIRPGSPYEGLGIRNGDLVRSIGGDAMTTPDRPLDLPSRLTRAAYSVALIERRGQPVRLEYCVTR